MVLYSISDGFVHLVGVNIARDSQATKSFYTAKQIKVLALVMYG